MSESTEEELDEGSQQDAEEAPASNSSQDGLVIRMLAELPERTLLDEAALASALRTSKRTVRRMVARYELPPPTPFVGRSMWQAGRVLAWFEERADRLARDADRQARKLSQTG